ncbi:hypothetical protein BDZ97DRAFT_1758596 [Flammula alnicola]|nr:hypothetical protein BDZ97DRAFT_1758596 [Flammula alnicola]
MNIDQYFSHPEIEFRPALNRSEKTGKKYSHSTRLDLLEVYLYQVIWEPKLDHSSLLHHFRKEDDPDTEKLQPLRIFFVDDLDLQASDDGKSDPLEVNTTAYWMRQHLGVSPLFFNCIMFPRLIAKIGNASLVRRENGKRVALDGLYRFSSRIKVPVVTHVWFSHSLIQGRSSTYVIHQCPENAKKALLSYAQGKGHSSMLLRPMAIDAFLQEDCLHEWGQEIIYPRNLLVDYENTRISEFTPVATAQAVENLHGLSSQLHVIQEDLNDLLERLQYLNAVHQRLMDLSISILTDNDDIDSVPDSLNYLLSKTIILKRWAGNYSDRTGIRINLLFNLSTQADNRTNLDIAKLTSKIAVSTQRDSSSMITLVFFFTSRMAAVTMFFLPGTFVSALFSMVFFNTTPDNSLSVGPQWWIFLVITVPLTVVVFATWVLWQRYRNRVDSRGLGIDRLEIIAQVPDNEKDAVAN